MAKGYVSDIDGCETVMEQPHGELFINLNHLPSMQGERLALYLHDNDVGEIEDDVAERIRLAVNKGEQYDEMLPTAGIHIDIQNLIMILNEANIANIPTGSETEDTSTPEHKEGV